MKRLYLLAALVCVFTMSACGKANSIGVIGGADGPTAILVSEENKLYGEKIPIRMFKAEGELYYDSGKVSDNVPRCGTLDRALLHKADEYEIPKNNLESNFGVEGVNFGYQSTGNENTKEVPIDGEWVIFNKLDYDGDLSNYKYCFYLKSTQSHTENETEYICFTETMQYSDSRILVEIRK